MAESGAGGAPPALEGNTTVDEKLSLDPERLGYRSAAAIAADIADNVVEHVRGKVVVVAGSDLLADLADLDATYVSLETIEREFASIATAAAAASKPNAVTLKAAAATAGVAAALPAVGALVNTALGLVGAFREDVEYKAANVRVDALAFELALASKLKEKGASKVYVPRLMISASAPAAKDPLTSRIARVIDARQSAWQALAPLVTELALLEARLDEAIMKKDEQATRQLGAQVASTRRAVEPISVPFGRIDQRFSDMRSRWSDTAPNADITGLARLLRAEAIRSLSPVYVHVSVVASGGYTRTMKNLWRTMFWHDGVSFAGGAVARWAVLESDGAITLAGIADAKTVES